MKNEYGVFFEIFLGVKNHNSKKLLSLKIDFGKNVFTKTF